MAHQLLVIRHAKSSWKDPELADHDRPLNKRGKRDGPRVVAALAGRLPLPDAIFVSPARRALDTLAMLPDLLGRKTVASARVEAGLYHARSEELLDLVRSQPDAHERIALIGHEPGLSDFVHLLLGPEGPRIEKFPTLAIALLDVETTWRTLGPRAARLAAFYRPKALPEETAA